MSNRDYYEILGLGRNASDDEIKRSIYARKPYRLWVQLNRVNLEDLDVKGDVPVAMNADKLHEMQLLSERTRIHLRHSENYELLPWRIR